MTAQMAKRVTEEYYSWFCGTELSGLERGRHLVCSAGRDQYLPAYGGKFTIWILVKDGLCVGAYSPKYQALFEELEKGGEIIPSLNQRFPMKRMELMVFESEKLSSYGEAKALAPADYPLYEAFFRQAYPDAEPNGWLKDYFTQKARGCFTGYLSGGRLLSVCDLPDMPYMQEKIQHTGIRTLEGERRKGYALCTAALAAHNLLANGVCPQWECSAENTASIELAKAVGYREYGTAHILEEGEK